MNWTGWLIPGLGLKRWIALFVLGVLALAAGALRPAAADHGLALLASVAGVVLVVGACLGFVASLLSALLPRGERDLAQNVVRLRALQRGPRFVVIGGGTGMPQLLRGLKRYTANITAVVTSADDGGSSGRLRSELQVLPPGDVRNCLLALSEAEPQLAELFRYRFDRGEGLTGHAFGNLFLAALERVTGSFEEAVVAGSKVLAVIGTVLPATRVPATLVMEGEEGQEVRGESAIGLSGVRPRRIYLDPPDVPASQEALRAIREADAILLAPGSLFTSVLPPLLVPEIREAYRLSRGLKIYIQNLMTEPGQTDGMTAREHLEALERLVGFRVAEWVIVNSEPLPEELRRRYLESGATPVAVDAGQILSRGYRLFAAPLLARDHLVRHDEEKLARAVLHVVLRHPPQEPRRRLEYFFLAERLRQEGGPP